MNLRYASIFVALVALCVSAALFVTACGSGFNHAPPPNSTPKPSGDVPEDIAKFRNDAVDLSLRPELDLPEVTIQYIQVAEGIDGGTETKPKQTLNEAEATAAKLYGKALAGDDFDILVLTWSYGRINQGQRPGMYTLVKPVDPPIDLERGPTTVYGNQEEPAVHRAAWRLQPGEIGAVERHQTDAATGFYVIRRVTDAELKQDDPANFPPPDEAIEVMRQDARALLLRAEHDAKSVKVQHVLIARYMSDPDGKMKRLTPAEAEALAAEVYAKARNGADFDELVREYTYDSTKGDPPGSYAMVNDRDDVDRDHVWRPNMIPRFGDAGWRLEPGEVGVIIYDRQKCWYGYHIIKRIK